jgi:hypothetical protein
MAVQTIPELQYLEELAAEEPATERIIAGFELTRNREGYLQFLPTGYHPVCIMMIMILAHLMTS